MLTVWWMCIVTVFVIALLLSPSFVGGMGPLIPALMTVLSAFGARILAFYFPVARRGTWQQAAASSLALLSTVRSLASGRTSSQVSPAAKEPSKGLLAAR